MNFRMLSCALALSALLSGTALASPVRWTFSSTFGGDDSFIPPYSGSYIYDADTLEFSDIFVTTPAGPIIPGSTYTMVQNPFAGPSRLTVVSSAAADLTGASVFTLRLDGPMTNAGGRLEITGGHERLCQDAPCTFGDPWRGLTRTVFKGVPVGQVPEPATLAFLATGLFGLGIARRRRQRASL